MSDTSPAFEQFQTHLLACLSAYRSGNLNEAWKEYDSAAIVFPLIPDSKTGTIEYRFARDQFVDIEKTLNRAAKRESSAATIENNNSRFKVACFRRKGER